jgi:dehydrogenase/reductase SDR family protein 12
VSIAQSRGAIRPRGCCELGEMTPTAVRAGLDRLLDASVFLSFDRGGFVRHAAAFDPDDLAADLAGRVCLITGANSGIGFETSASLAARGATVWMLCRDRSRGEVALREVRKRTGSRRIHLGLLDVADPDSVRNFASAFTAPRVDVLVHNAGVLPAARVLSVDGHELTLATHVLGRHVLATAVARRRRVAAAPL